MPRARNKPKPRLVTWPAALLAAQAEGYTHLRLLAVNRGNGVVPETNRPFQQIADALAEVIDHPEGFELRCERVDLPAISTMIIYGPLAGTVVAEYECERRPTVWQRLRDPWIADERDAT